MVSNFYTFRPNTITYGIPMIILLVGQQEEQRLVWYFILIMGDDLPIMQARAGAKVNGF